MEKLIYLFIIAIFIPPPTLITLLPKFPPPRAQGVGVMPYALRRWSWRQSGDLTGTAPETQDNREEEEKKGKHLYSKIQLVSERKSHTHTDPRALLPFHGLLFSLLSSNPLKTDFTRIIISGEESFSSLPPPSSIVIFPKTQPSIRGILMFFLFKVSFSALPCYPHLLRKGFTEL